MLGGPLLRFCEVGFVIDTEPCADCLTDVNGSWRDFARLSGYFRTSPVDFFLQFLCHRDTHFLFHSSSTVVPYSNKLNARVARYYSHN